MVPQAYLRAFEPLDLLPPGERERWRTLLEQGSATTVGAAVATEARVAATGVLTGRRPAVTETALVRSVRGRAYVCPTDLALRTAHALVAFHDLIPSEVVGHFVRGDDAGRARAAVAAAGRAPHIRAVTWAIPLHWFVLFDPGERRFEDFRGMPARLGYRTTAAAAERRLARAVELVDAYLAEGESVLHMLADLGDWLADFPPASLIELDYGSVAGLVPRRALAADRTCEDLWQAIDRLADGDLLGAATRFGAARSRWTRLELKQRAS